METSDFGLVTQCVILALSCFISRGNAYSTGSPWSICINHFPHHNHLPQQYTTSPYVIEVTPDTYRPGDLLTVRLHSPSGEQFNGYQVRAMQVGGNEEQLLGSFVDIPENTKLQAWYPDDLEERNCFTHTTNDKRSDISVTWRAPNISVGSIVFRGTMMKDFETFWVNVTSNVVSPAEPIAVMNRYEPNHVWSTVTNKDFIRECGKSRGCVLYPKGCSGNECTQVVSYAANSTSKMIRFDLYVTDSPGFVAVGFSHDLKMGEDSTVTCVQANDLNEVHYGYSPAHYNQRHKLDPVRILDAAVERDGNALYCSFLRSFEDTFLKFDSDTDTFSRLSFDFTDQLYIQLAWGGVYEATSIPWKHTHLPLNSIEKVILTKTEITFASSMPNEYKVHSSFGIIGWVVLASFGMLMSRHFKSDIAKQVGKGICAKAMWFHLHFWSMLGCVAVATVGVVVMFVFRAGWTKSARIHAVLGLVTGGIALVNILAGFVRPSPDSKWRPLFLWGHRVFGVSAFFLAWVTLFFGANSELLSATIQSKLNIILFLWLACVIVFEAIFEIYGCIIRKKDIYRVDETGDNSRTHPAKWVLLAVFLIVTIALLIAFICVISDA